MRDSCRGQRRSGEPGVESGEVHRCGDEYVLEMGLGGPAVAGSSQAEAFDTLGDGSFDALPCLVAAFPLVGLLFGPCPGQDLVFGSRT